MKMVMKRRTTVLLMLSLLVVLVGSIAADAADGVDQAIRLPSDGNGKERPWDCCDSAGCTRSIPPICRCGDVVEKCAAACKDCEEAPSCPGRYVCKDIYTGWPGPTCRPWDCCDLASCTKSIPPICWCTDVVEQCAAACKDCEEAPSSPGRYVCKDTYTGWPGPTCTGTN